MDQYHRLSDASADSSISDHSMNVSPGVIKVLKEHGYTIKKKLGQGNSGIVFLVNDTDGDPYVVKQMNSRDGEELDSVRKEVEILKTLNFGYIVTYVNSFEDKEAGRIYIVMEYCEGGDLSKVMETRKEERFFEEKEILDWLVQICLALQYLHEKKVIHRDIKPQNVFLTEDGYVNLGDFGCSKALERADEYANSVVGAKLYVSPEVYQGKHNSKSDIWSLGWLLHDLCMLDVWADGIQRHIVHAVSMAGNPPHVSEKYSVELRELIRQMLSCDPKDRPSAEEILAKPFLNDAVNRNSRTPEALLQSVVKSIDTFDKAYNKHFKDIGDLVSEWGRITDSMESAHYSATAGSLSGSVIGAAGGITALVGLILAPFTLGASLIVTGVGVGVGVAGGVTGAASTITNTVQQKSYRESLEQIQQKYNSVSEPILTPLNTLRKVLRKIAKFNVFFGNSAFDNVQISCNLNKRNVFCAIQLMNLGLLANVSRIATQTARVGRVVAEAVSGVLSGLLVIVDVAFIVMDSVDIHQMRQGKVDDPEKVKSSLLKSIAEMRRTHNELCNVQREIQTTREELKAYIELVKDDKEIDNDFNSLNI
ncbi:serine/threonine-protein kinase 3 [Labeo rohita]|uniref:serine/threonine-protein kinase 3 n=1 Tax=Labeo rohita TaxID=84645 RepID=UPI0021E22B6B|nr:serine/threonine-protein kinase 3 [Labeo rohita]XP_050958143.1 serine/threonine-protein kinase 3 [Labeo rohita]XP_050958144.1 serine/threonine-protein kinase 3 [Labeo rohita]